MISAIQDSIRGKSHQRSIRDVYPFGGSADNRNNRTAFTKADETRIEKSPRSDVQSRSRRDATTTTEADAIEAELELKATEDASRASQEAASDKK